MFLVSILIMKRVINSGNELGTCQGKRTWKEQHTESQHNLKQQAIVGKTGKILYQESIHVY